MNAPWLVPPTKPIGTPASSSARMTPWCASPREPPPPSTRPNAQPASVPIASGQAAPEAGQWVEVSGTVRAASDGTLTVDAAEVTAIDEPEDPYEY